VAAATQVGVDIVITLDASNAITLTGVTKTALNVDDFAIIAV
jgi:hypothetical protein